MDLSQAREAVGAESDSVRLAAARLLANRAGAGDLQLLQDRLMLEEVAWIRRVLRDGINRLEIVPPPEQDAPAHPDVAPEVYESIYARALEEVTHQVVHEVRSIVGTADYYAGLLIADYEATRLSAEFERLRDALRSVSLLGEAASVPTFGEFDLAELITDIVEEERKPLGVAARSVGTQPFLVTSDRGLVDMVLRNAVRNACEATSALCERTGADAEDRPVTISWQLGDNEFVVAVLDEGPGLPASRSRAWEIGVTTKRGHSGVGLATARQAARSLDGTVDLRPGQRGGALFEFRFPVLEGVQR
jgi:signal transduction histidine kinase